MGACLSWRTYKTDDVVKARAMFKEDQERDIRQNGDSYSGGIGMCDGVSDKIHVFTTHDEAVQYICDNAEKWEEALVTRFKDNSGETKFLIGGLCSS